jgi:hypothetical protein
MSRLRKIITDQLPEEEAAAIASSIALYMQNTKFVIKRIEPLDESMTLFKMSEEENAQPDAQYSFFTWRPEQ